MEHILNEDVERVLSQHLVMDSWEEGFISAARFALENKCLVYHIYNSVSRERVERYLYSIARRFGHLTEFAYILDDL